MTAARLTIPGALLTARQHCQPECFPYHSTWRLFRRAGLKGHPGWHTGFYQRALSDHGLLDEHGRVKVLVCAASDESMLKVLVALLGADRLDVHLVDACRTPLVLAETYAAKTGVRLTTEQATAPHLPLWRNEFDVVITDGLLSLLPDTVQRQQLITHLAHALTRNGLLLYTARIAGQAGVLEYDGIGRRIQAGAMRWLAPHPATQRLTIARNVLSRPARPSPFPDAAAVREAFTHSFNDVQMFHRAAPASVALSVHPEIRKGTGSSSVGIAAHRPKDTP